MYELSDEDRYFASRIESNRDEAYPYYLRIRANPYEATSLPNDVIRIEVINHFNIKYASAPAWLYIPLFPYGYELATTPEPEDTD
jgi:hypothetical protein